MLLRAALLALAIGLSPFSAGAAAAADAIPDEPGAIVLPDAPILQAVAADLDGDGSREVVRLVRGEEDAALAEIWGLGATGWALVDEPVQVLPAIRDGPRVNPVYAGVPLRLLVHRVAGVERVVVASQPRFDEIDSGPACCLVLHALVLEAGEVRRVAVAQPTEPVDGILAIDLDGDRTDELLTVRSLPPLGGISFPTDARVYRWADNVFGPPTASELPIGSGDTPFLIGDSDGRPGDEAAFISTLGPPGLYRIVFGPADSLTVDEFGAIVTGARGVPMGDRRGIAVVIGDEVALYRWPAFGPPGAVEASIPVREAELIGVVGVGGDAHLLVHEPSSSTLRALVLPSLTPVRGGRLTHSLSARAFGELPIAPYVGPVPGGGPDGAEAAIFAGHFLPSPAAGIPLPLSGATVSATLFGAEPVGLVADRGWMAILHSPHGTPPVAATGGRFDSPTPRSDSWLSIAPLSTILSPEVNDGVLDSAVTGALQIGDAAALTTGRTGFVADIAAPAGSRVLGTDVDPPVLSAPATVPAGGRLSVRVVPPAVDTPNPRYRTARIVITPAGHAYIATWTWRSSPSRRRWRWQSPLRSVRQRCSSAAKPRPM